VDVAAAEPPERLRGNADPVLRTGDLPAERAIHRDGGRVERGYQVTELTGPVRERCHELRPDAATSGIGCDNHAGDTTHGHTPTAPELLIRRDFRVTQQPSAVEDADCSVRLDGFVMDAVPPVAHRGVERAKRPRPHVKG